jgi:hypothetical protein
MGSGRDIKKEDTGTHQEKVEGGDGQSPPPAEGITLAEVNRLLDAGQLLASALTPEERAEIRALLDEGTSEDR